jgi:hypothetical protein
VSALWFVCELALLVLVHGVSCHCLCSCTSCICAPCVLLCSQNAHHCTLKSDSPLRAHDNF